MSIQQNGFNPLVAQQRTLGSPSINSGISAGNVFDGQGNDFLSPNNVLGNVHDFTGSISPITSNNNFSVFSDPFGKNPKSSSLLKGTTASIKDILSPNFGLNLLGTASSSGAVVQTTTTVNGQIGKTPSNALIRDLGNFNPLIWQNPNSTNVMLGTMDAQNKIFGGNGLFTPPTFNQYPLYPFIALPSPPFSGNTIPVPSQNGINTLQQAQIFPTTFLTNSPFYNLTFQPYSVSTTQSITPYQVQVALVALLQTMGEQGGLISGGGINQLVPPNGVPPWIA